MECEKFAPGHNVYQLLVTYMYTHCGDGGSCVIIVVRTYIDTTTCHV